MRILPSLPRSAKQMLIPAGAAALFSSITGCAPPNEFVEPPPLQVDVERPVVKDTTIYLEFPGRTQALERVEIRARVKGFLEEIKFQAGQFVNKEDVLYIIEPEEYVAALDEARAKEAQAAANLQLAETKLKAMKKAFTTKAVSEIEVESAAAEKSVAAASVESAKAEVAKANLNKRYTEIEAPTSGRVSRTLVDIGNLVGASDATLLTTLVKDDEVYVNFEVNERTILPFLGGRRDGRSNPEIPREEREKSLQLVLSDRSRYKDNNGDLVLGAFDFIDNAIDPDSGTIKVRAIFDNTEGKLADGLFVRVRIPQQVENAVHVRRTSVQRDLQGNFVLVVGENNTLERRAVTPTQFTDGDYRIVSDAPSGEVLGADDLVVVTNLQRARDGLVVAPTEVPASLAEGGTGDDGTPDEDRGGTGAPEGQDESGE